jgi:hypothetical protein
MKEYTSRSMKNNREPRNDSHKYGQLVFVKRAKMKYGSSNGIGMTGPLTCKK